jgi:transcriptional regulator with XRE-family HTH domain
MVDSIHPIRAYRKAQKPPLSLEELAVDLGTTKATLSRIENGVMDLSVKLAKKIADRTGLSMAVLCPDLAPMFETERPQASEAAQ